MKKILIINTHHPYPSSGGALNAALTDLAREHLEQKGYQVWPLAEVLTGLQQPDTLPERVVAITVDDAYRSVHVVLSKLVDAMRRGRQKLEVQRGIQHRPQIHARRTLGRVVRQRKAVAQPPVEA